MGANLPFRVVQPLKRIVLSSSFQCCKAKHYILKIEYRVPDQSESIHFSCTPCIVEALTDCETSRNEFSSSLRTFSISFKFVVTFTVSELLSKNWFDATNFQISSNWWFEIRTPCKSIIFGSSGILNHLN